jgi:hypothetical protein
MWTRETLGRGDASGLEFPSMLDHDGDTRMAMSRTGTVVVEGTRRLVWGWETLGEVGCWGLNRGGSGAVGLRRFGLV